MNKIKGCFFFLLLVLIGLMVSCAKNSTLLKDGYYTAEEAEFNSSGWKEYLSICVSGGQIIIVEYNAFNTTGFIKSWDGDYMRAMQALAGTYPSAYYRHYSQQLIDRQDAAGIDAVSGASRSYLTFMALTKAVLKNAHEGDRKTALVHFGEQF